MALYHDGAPGGVAGGVGGLDGDRDSDYDGKAEMGSFRPPVSPPGCGRALKDIQALYLGISDIPAPDAGSTPFKMQYYIICKDSCKVLYRPLLMILKSVIVY